MRPIIVNGAFVGQHITGQQRYATEVTKRLVQYPDVKLVKPPSRAQAGRGAPWLWSQSLSLREPDATLLSMTARSPMFRRNHVVVVHDAFPLTNPEWYTKAYVATHAPILKHHLRHAHGIIAVSPPTLEAVSPWLREGMPVIVAPNGLTPELTSLTDATAEQILGRHGLIPNTYFICVGSVDPRKNISRLLAAYATLSVAARTAHPLVIVGDSDSRIFAADDERIDRGIKRLGRVSDEELGALYSSAKAFVLPSLNEGFGIPVLEAAAHHLPLLLSDIPVFKWVAEATDAHFFDPLSVTSLADALASEIESPAKRTRYGHVALTRFDWNVTARAIYDFVSQV